MNTSELVEWQIRDPDNGLVMPWLTHPFLAELKTWSLSDKIILEFGAGRSTAWWRKKAHWVKSVEANTEWALQAWQDCADAELLNGMISNKDIPDGVPERMPEYFDLIKAGMRYQTVLYDIIVVDGIYRYECIEWALNHFQDHPGVIIADNWQQDYVWISPKAEELMSPYEIHRFEQPDHTNHEGRPWNTCYWNIEPKKWAA